MKLSKINRMQSLLPDISEDIGELRTDCTGKEMLSFMKTMQLSDAAAVIKLWPLSKIFLFLSSTELQSDNFQKQRDGLRQNRKNYLNFLVLPWFYLLKLQENICHDTQSTYKTIISYTNPFCLIRN